MLHKERLSKPFDGFDSIDPRMERIPNDLNDDALREDYLQKHITWFLKNHENAIDDFYKQVDKKYGLKQKRADSKLKQPTLFEQTEEQPIIRGLR